MDGTDELTVSNLSDILMLGIISTPNTATQTYQYSNSSGSISGTFQATNINQFFFEDASGTSQRLEIPSSGGLAATVVGTPGNDNINIAGDGTSSPEIISGSLTLDVDNSAFFGSIVFGGDGDDTITSTAKRASQSLIFGGNGNDTINANSNIEVIQAGPGDDTIVFGAPVDLIAFSGFSTDSISGGTNGTAGDTIQIGNSSTSSGLTFITQDSNNFVNIAGIENLDFFTSNTTFQAPNELFILLNNITTQSGVTDITLKAFGTNLNLSTASVSSGVTTLSANSSFGSGVTIIDSNENIDRTLIGSDDNDTITGFGGNDIFIMGAGRDSLSGGDGNDTFIINAASDISSGISISGGNGDDTLSVNSTTISSLVFPNAAPNFTSFITLEKFDLSGGSSSGVTLNLADSAISSIPEFIGDGTRDIVNVNSGTFLDTQGLTFTGIQEINLTQADTLQRINLEGDSTNFKDLESITGTLDTGGSTDDEILVFDDFDFSGISINNVTTIGLAGRDTSSVEHTIGVDKDTDFGTALIRGFGLSNTAQPDILDYKSDLVGGTGSSVGNAASDVLTVNNVTSKATDIISSSTSAVIDIEFSEVPIELQGTSETEIVSAVQSLLQSTNPLTNLTGTSSAVSQGSTDTDALLIFYEAATFSGQDAVILRYAESGGDASFEGELDVLAVFDNISPDITFSNASII